MRYGVCGVYLVCCCFTREDLPPRAMESLEVARQPRPRYITQQRGRNADSGTLHKVGISRQGTTVSSNLKQDTRQSE